MAQQEPMTNATAPRMSAGPTPFTYGRPEVKRGKQVVTLGRTDRMIANVQVLKEGGENNLHSHPNLDGFWFVLRGKVRFYGPGDELLGEFGEHEGILVPRGSQYWFESSSDVPLEILQVEAFDRALTNWREVIGNRVNVNPVKTDPIDVEVYEGRTFK